VNGVWLGELVGQAQRKKVGAVGAKLLFPNGTIQHSGVVLGVTGFAAHPFWGLPAHAAHTPFGHPDWARNYLAVTSACVMMRRDVFEKVGKFDEQFQVCGSDVDICLRLGDLGLRTVYTPHAELLHHESVTRRQDDIPERDFWLSFARYRRWLRDGDPYYNRNLTLHGSDCGLRADVATGEELALAILGQHAQRSLDGHSLARAQQQQHMAEHVAVLDGGGETARAHNRVGLRGLNSRGRVERVTWLVPFFRHPYGGVHTILRFGDLWRRRHGIESHFVIYDHPSATAREMEARAAVIFPELPGTFEVLESSNQVEALPASDLTIATLWTSAYFAVRHKRARVKAYFVQDFEPLFYPAGTMFGLAEETYRLGLYGIFNTPGLKDFVTANYPMDGVAFEPTVDRSLFNSSGRTGSRPPRVFFYGRPATDRNGFELGIAALRRLKADLGQSVDIVSAGENWAPESYGLRGIVNNLGVLPYEKTADLYRTCDVGLCFMFTKHPSYLPLEMMACGVTVVTNSNPANLWVLADGKNCLLTEPVVGRVVQQLRRAVNDRRLRQRLGLAASRRMLQTTWEAQADLVHAALLGRVASGLGSGRPRELSRASGG
jgi:glycosyltransferase involved in cell wall biosynthesis